MLLPPTRGRVSAELIDRLARPPEPCADLAVLVADALADVADAVADVDLQLSLAICYELHYRGFDDVDDDWEWEPSLLAARAVLERCFTAYLRDAVPAPEPTGDVAQQLRELIAADDAPSLSKHLVRYATRREFVDFVQQRSVYHLREADSHTWAIPRLSGRAKAALVEIQSDEYGNGDVRRMHSVMFAAMMRSLGIDDTYGAWWPQASAETFALVNLMSFLGLHRRHRGALLGHLAVFEMTSTIPNRRYGNGVRRLGWTAPAAVAFYDEHVEADAVHEQLASVDMCGSFVAAEPELAQDLLWGAACALHLDGRAARATLDGWALQRDAECLTA